MSDLKSTIRIEDGFTEPLKNLTKAAFEACDGVDAIAESIIELEGVQEELKDAVKDSAKEFAVNVVGQIITPAFKKIPKLARSAGREVSFHAQFAGLQIQRYVRDIQVKTQFAGLSAMNKFYHAQDVLLAKSWDIQERYHLNDLNRNQKMIAIACQLEDKRQKFVAASAEKTSSALRTIARRDFWTHENFENQKNKLIQKTASIRESINRRYSRIDDSARRTLLNERGVEGIRSIHASARNARGSGILYHLLANRRISDRTFHDAADILSQRTGREMLGRTSVIGQRNVATWYAKNILGKNETAANAYGRRAETRGIISLLPTFARQTRARITDNIANTRINLRDGLTSMHVGARERLLNAGKAVTESQAFQQGKGFLTGAAKGFAISFGDTLVTKVMMNASKKIIEGAKELSDALRTAIENSLDDLEVSDKLASRFGDAGKKSGDYVYGLSNKLGESSIMMGEMAAKAAQGGIGTKSFERIMLLADKIGKLSVGETTESAANTLISSIKSGHDASSISQMLGGGQVMERQLKRAGYERALMRGNIDKALEIAEKITEQAGLTDEKYQKASRSMSQNYKVIANTIGNIKRKLSQIFVEQLAPSVNKIRELTESRFFKIGVKAVEKSFKALGSVVNWLVEGIVDNIKLIAVILSIGAIAKLGMIIKQIQAITGMVGLVTKVFPVVTGILMTVKTRLVSIIALLRAKLALHRAGAIAGTAEAATLDVINRRQRLSLVLSRAFAGIKVMWPLAAVAAVGALIFGMHKLLGVSKSTLGFLAGGWQFAVNCFANLFVLIDRIPSYFKMAWAIIKMGILTDMQWIQEKVSGLLIDMLNGISNVASSIAETVGADDWAKKLKFDATSSVKSYFSIDDAAHNSYMEKLSNQIDGLRNGQMGFINVMSGVEDWYKLSNSDVQKEMLDKLSMFMGVGKEMSSNLELIGDDTTKIREANEQEEELKWMKAFSDRQIMSSYNSMTNNSRTVNINGMSQASLAEMGRRNIATIPSRAAL